MWKLNFKTITFQLFMLFLYKNSFGQILSSNYKSFPTYTQINCNTSPKGTTLSYVYDSINEKVYVGGNFKRYALGSFPTGGINCVNRYGLFCYDLISDTITSFSPLVNGTVNSIVLHGSSLIIGGNYIDINGISRNNLCIIDTNSNLNLWNPNPNGIVNKCIVSNNYLYVFGNFSNINGQARNGFAQFDLSTLSITSLNYPPGFLTSNVFIKAIGDKFYFKDANNEKIIWTPKNSFNTDSLIIFNAISANYNGSENVPIVNDIVILNNKIYGVGELTHIDSLSYPIQVSNAFCYDLQTKLPTNFKPIIDCGANGIETLEDSLIIFSTGYLSTFCSGATPPIMISDTLTGNYRTGNYYYLWGMPTQLNKYADKIMMLGGTPGTSGYGNFEIYCLTPKPIALVTAAQTNICTGSILTYHIKLNSRIKNYTVTYTGTGSTRITNSRGDSTSIYFPPGSTSGQLKIVSHNFCGNYSDSIVLNLNVNETPIINSLPDTLLTCLNDTINLIGSSDISPTINAQYQWTLPNTTTTTINPLQATSGGNYILTATNSSSGCFKKDTLFIAIDTLKPALSALLNTYGIPCSPNSVAVSGSSTNTHAFPDSIWWQSPSNAIIANPLQTSTIGNFVFHAQDPFNGCSSTDTITVFNNTTPPNFTLPTNVDTITCLVDSVQLMGSSASASTSLFWIQIATGDTLTNPCYADTIGAYKLVVVDNTNNCISNGIVTVNEYITPPNLSITNSNPSVNCSNSSATITGNSLTPGATLVWNGAAGFTSSNPATISAAGTYTLTATDVNNGCTKQDSIAVIQQNILILNAANDTTICNGSFATISSSAIGGTSPFTYSWNNGAGNNQIATISPTVSTNYVLTITDGAGCVGTDTILVNVPALVNDSTLSFQPCDTANPNGQIQVFAFGGIPPYQYSINNGIAFQASQIFTGLNYGTFPVVVKDSLACTYSHSVIINQLSSQPSTDFIVNTSMMQGDTFVVVDISNPRPDTVIWTFPAQVQVINSDPFNPIIVSADTGSFAINMEAHFGTCVINYSKNVQFIKPDTASANANNNNGIESITAYPNPNTGQFTLEVKLYKKQSFVVSIVNTAGAELYRQTAYENNYFSSPIQLTNAANGTYYIKVIAEYDAKTKTFVISN